MGFMYEQKLNDRLYLLAEKAGPAVVTMWLVLGEDSAALIDSGVGITGTLRKVVERITDKPVLHLVTHCDPDHAGASALFDDIRMSALDAPLQAAALRFDQRVHDLTVVVGDKPLLKALIKLYLNRNMVRAETFSYTDIHDGERFDLGGVTLEAFALPGHTKGSFCFINQADGYVITGDSLVTQDAAVVGDPRCAPLATFRRGVERFIARGLDKLDVYVGHRLDPLDPEIPGQLVAACDEILAGETAQDDAVKLLFGADGLPQAYEHRFGKARIQYLPDNLLD